MPRLGCSAMPWSSPCCTRRPASSEGLRQGEAKSQRLERMEVPVGDACRRLSGQARDVVVVDLARLRVQEVEGIEVELDARFEDVAYAGVEGRGERGIDTAVGDQRPWAEAAQTQRTEPAGVAAERDPARGDESRRARNLVAAERIVGEARQCVGKVEIEAHPWPWPIAAGQFHADPSARPARLGG